MLSSVKMVGDNQVDHLEFPCFEVRIAPEDKGFEPESYTLRKEVAQEKECAIRAEAQSLKALGGSLSKYIVSTRWIIRGFHVIT